MSDNNNNNNNNNDYDYDDNDDDDDDDNDDIFNPSVIVSEETLNENEIPNPPEPLTYTTNPDGSIELSKESKKVIEESNRLKKMKRFYTAEKKSSSSGSRRIE